MDWDDILNEMYCTNNKLEAEELIISKKEIHNSYSVERSYINSQSYHHKFELMPVNRDIQEILYQETGRLLEHADGQEKKYMMALNGRTGKLLLDNFDRIDKEENLNGEKSFKTGFTDEEYNNNIKCCKDSVILIHNHPLNGRPSGQDFLTFLKEEKIKLSIAACHDGTLYEIRDVNPKFEDIYNDFLEYAKQISNDRDEIKYLALTKLIMLNEKLGNRHKLYDLKEHKNVK